MTWILWNGNGQIDRYDDISNQSIVIQTTTVYQQHRYIPEHALCHVKHNDWNKRCLKKCFCLEQSFFNHPKESKDERSREKILNSSKVFNHIQHFNFNKSDCGNQKTNTWIHSEFFTTGGDVGSCSGGTSSGGASQHGSMRPCVVVCALTHPPVWW